LSADFAKLWKERTFSDIEIEVGEGTAKKVWNLHKAIISTRSDFFKAMFTSSMKESAKTKITLQDVLPEVFEEAVEYMYTGSCSTADLTSLLEAATFLQIEGLRNDLCLQFKSAVRRKNALTLLELSLRFHCPSLTTACLRCIEKNANRVLLPLLKDPNSQGEHGDQLNNNNNTNNNNTNNNNNPQKEEKKASEPKEPLEASDNNKNEETKTNPSSEEKNVPQTSFQSISYETLKCILGSNKLNKVNEMDLLECKKKKTRVSFVL
jgi:hypothetical protein